LRTIFDGITKFFQINGIIFRNLDTRLFSLEVSTSFKKLNADWNADPDEPFPRVSVRGSDVFLCFQMSSVTERRFSFDDIGELRFQTVWCLRFEEGWTKESCRFSKLKPAWPEFYEVSGDLLPHECPSDWIYVGPEMPIQKHFLFYFADHQFEIKAASWSFKVLGQSQPILYSIP
jgi:hypothetical protein